MVIEARSGSLSARLPDGDGRRWWREDDVPTTCDRRAKHTFTDDAHKIEPKGDAADAVYWRYSLPDRVLSTAHVCCKPQTHSHRNSPQASPRANGPSLHALKNRFLPRCVVDVDRCVTQAHTQAQSTPPVSRPSPTPLSSSYLPLEPFSTLQLCDITPSLNTLRPLCKLPVMHLNVLHVIHLLQFVISLSIVLIYFSISNFFDSCALPPPSCIAPSPPHTPPSASCLNTSAHSSPSCQPLPPSPPAHTSVIVIASFVGPFFFFYVPKLGSTLQNETCFAT